MSCFDPDAPASPQSGLYGLTHSAEEAAVHVLPVPFDATASYRKGAARAPEAILAASHQVELFDPEPGRRAYEAGIHMLAEDPRVAELQVEASALTAPIQAGTGLADSAAVRERVDAIGAEVNERVRERCERSLEAGKLVCLLGGDHSTPFGAMQAAAERHPGLGILHFDAHADLREAYEGFAWSHASILHNVLTRLPGVSSLVQVGLRDPGKGEFERIRAEEGRVHALFDREWAATRLGGGDLGDLVRRTLAHLPSEVYVTFDVDGLDPSLCPNTGTPVPGGLTWHEALLWLEELALSGKRVVGLDLVEVSPGPEGDPEGQGWDAVVGARLLYRLIGTALRTL